MHLMADLEKKTGYAARAIRIFVTQGLLPRPTFRGRLTTYDDDFLLRVLAIRSLRRARVPPDAIRDRLADASDAELRKLAGVPEPIATPATSSPSPTESTLRTVGERWTRVALAPGLDLLLREGATPEVERLALEIRARVLAAP
jgi:DNA-binding transcriptional MerR regulator